MRATEPPACLVLGGLLYRRHKLKEGSSVPAGWRHWTGEEMKSGHGWLIVGDNPVDGWHRDAWTYAVRNVGIVEDGTYELVGPKVQKNPYGLQVHELWRHGQPAFEQGMERTYDGLKKYLDQSRPKEGIVFHHPDGRMAKIKRRDFGLEWPA